MAEEQHDLERDLISAVLTCYHTTRLSEVSAEAHIQAKPLFRQAVEALRRVPAVEAEPVAWRWRYPNTAWETVFERKAWFDDGDERLIVEPLYTAPPPAWKPPREAVARIVDPQAFAYAEEDRAKAVQWHKKADDYWETEDVSTYPYGQISKDRIFKSWKEHAEGYEQSAIKRTVSAYARADAILALQPEQAG